MEGSNDRGVRYCSGYFLRFFLPMRLRTFSYISWATNRPFGLCLAKKASDSAVVGTFSTNVVLKYLQYQRCFPLHVQTSRRGMNLQLAPQELELPVWSPHSCT